MKSTRSSALALRVQDLLKNRPRSVTLADINAATGAPVHFLTRLSCGHFNDGPAARLEAIYEYLSGRPVKFK